VIITEEGEDTMNEDHWEKGGTETTLLASSVHCSAPSDSQRSWRTARLQLLMALWNRAIRSVPWEEGLPLPASNVHVRMLLEEYGRSFFPNRVLTSSNTYRQAGRCSSHHPVDQGYLADHEAHQEAQWDGDEHSDGPFEQRIERHHVEGIRKPD
jgi:hypothetical protein